MQRDGYYIMSAVCVTLGAGLLVVFILPMIRRLAGESLALPSAPLFSGFPPPPFSYWLQMVTKLTRNGTGSLALPMSAWRVKIPN